jgi:thioredoxin 1
MEIIMSDVIALNESNFEKEVLQASEVVLVDFWAPWCRPCNALMPVIQELAKTHTVCKVNVDENQDLAAKYNVQAIPALLFFKGGQQVGTMAGIQNVKVLEDKFKKLEV